LFYFDGETAFVACILRATTRIKVVNFFEEKVHPDDLTGGFSDLEMTPLLRLCRHCLRVVTNMMIMTMTSQQVTKHNTRESHWQRCERLLQV